MSQVYDWSKIRFFIGANKLALPTITSVGGMNVGGKITSEKTWGAGDKHVGIGRGKKDYDNLTFDLGGTDVAAIITNYFNGDPDTITDPLLTYIPFTIEFVDDNGEDVFYVQNYSIARILSCVSSLSEGTTTDTMFSFECLINDIKTTFVS